LSGWQCAAPRRAWLPPQPRRRLELVSVDVATVALQTLSLAAAGSGSMLSPIVQATLKSKSAA
jgi:hypothetical protein